jgi:hypothetical protein
MIILSFPFFEEGGSFLGCGCPSFFFFLAESFIVFGL